MKIEDIVDCTRGTLISGDPRQGCRASDFSTDSRTITEGQIFVAIKGPHFDGHTYSKDAFRKGARGAVVSRAIDRSLAAKLAVIQVRDTLKAYGDIAAYHRSHFNIPVVAVTGSNGKTMVKEMIASILSAKYRVLKNAGTENNHVGVPRTILKLDASHEMIVLEMGMNHLGEIAALGRIARPDIAVITNIGPSHLEFLGSLRNIFKAKRELLRCLSNDGTAVLNGDDPFLATVRQKDIPIVTFGFSQGCHFRATKVSYSNTSVRFCVKRDHVFELRLPGRHSVYNALAAIAACSRFGLSLEAMRAALRGFTQPPMRLAVTAIGGVTVINDSYNSNPLSMRCAIEVLRDYRSKGRKIVVAGDMAELGRRGKWFHRDIGSFIARSKIDFLLTMGELSREICLEAKRSGMDKDRVYHCRDHREVARVLRGVAKSGDVVLLKGSRSMKMEGALACYTTCSTR